MEVSASLGLLSPRSLHSFFVLSSSLISNQINPASFASAFGNRGQQQQQMLSPQFLQALAGQRQLQQVAPTGRVNGGW